MEQPPRTYTNEMKKFTKSFLKPIKLQILGVCGNKFTIIFMFLLYAFIFSIFNIVGLTLPPDILALNLLPVAAFVVLYIISNLMTRNFSKQVKSFMIYGTRKDITVQGSSLNYGYQVNMVPQHVFDILLDNQIIKIGTHDSRIINIFSRSKGVPVLWYDKSPNVLVPIELILPANLNMDIKKPKIKKVNML